MISKELEDAMSALAEAFHDETQLSQRELLGYQLNLTCGACPEQYDVFLDGEKVAYLRLRHGTFRVDVPDCGDETIFEGAPQGDGIFNRDEREVWLTRAINAVNNWRAQRGLRTGAPRTKWIYEAQVDASDVKIEDGGRAKIIYDVFSYGGEGGASLWPRIHSWDDEKKHEEFQTLVGKRVRVTIEVLD